MRTRSATALSVAAVAVAGLVAAFVNVRALAGAGGGDSPSGSTHLLVPTSAGPTPSGPAPSGPTPSGSTPSGPTGTVPTDVVYAVGSAGAITLDSGHAALTLVAVSPATGWSVTSVTSTGTDTVVVDFASGTATLRATATLRDSQVTVAVAAGPVTDSSTDPSTVTVVAPPATLSPNPTPDAVPTQATSTTVVRDDSGDHNDSHGKHDEHGDHDSGEADD